MWETYRFAKFLIFVLSELLAVGRGSPHPLQ